MRTSAAKARTAYQRVQVNLKAVAAAHDPEDEAFDPEHLACVVGEIMDDVDDDLRDIIGFLNCSDRKVFDRDALRNLLLAGDSLVVPLLTFAGPGRLTLAIDDEVPVCLDDRSRGGTLAKVWAEIKG